VDTSVLVNLPLLSSQFTFMVSGRPCSIPLCVNNPARVIFLGFVYDISSGLVYDLNASQGPPGYKADYSKCKRNLITSIRHGNTNPSNVEGC